MNSCRMTFKILVALLFALTLCVPTMAEKIGDPSGPTTLQQAQGIIDNDAALKDVPAQPGELPDPSHQEFPEDLKVAPHQAGIPDNGGQRTGYLTEGFEGGVIPPTGWTEIALDTSNWTITTSSHSGSYAATCYYDAGYQMTQDEWIISPVLDLTSATSDLKLDFWWNMSYYWSVDPYNYYDLEVWISTDGGATFSTKLWDENGEGVFTNWTWYQEVISLSAYVGQSNVKIGFRYHGYDGAQASVDDINVNDNPPPTGRCCYNNGTCADITEAACLALAGTWDITKTCATDPCPVGPTGIDCSAPLPIDIDPLALPLVVDNQTTVGALDDYNATCMGYYDGGEDRIYKITVGGSGRIPIRIKLNPGTTTYTGFGIATACPLPASGCYLIRTNSSSGAYFIDTAFTGGSTYYMQVDTWPSPTNIPSYSIEFSTPPAPPANDNCAAAIAVGNVTALPFDLSAATFDGPGGFITAKNIWYTYTATCDGIATFSTCGSSYDTKIRVFKTVVCPPLLTDTLGQMDNGCSAPGSTLASKLVRPVIAGHTYLIEVGPYSSTTAIGTGYLNVSCDLPPANDACANAQVIGDVTDLPFNTSLASNDGPGGWIYGPNIWYKYTATCNGNVTVDLCNTSYDTRLRVYKKDGCPVIADSIGGDDDACTTPNGLGSYLRFYSAPGETYMIEVGGYSTNSGTGFLTVVCQVSPPRDNCADAVPVTLTPGVPVTFTGNNAGSSPDCSLLSSYNETWEAFTITQCMDVTLDYCGTTPAFSNALLNLVVGCPCGSLSAAATYNTTACGDGNVQMTWAGLAAGTYYYPVIEGSGYSGAYTLHVVANVPTSYCAATATTCDEYISAVSVGTIDNYSDCGLVSNYSDYTALSTDMVQGLSYPITVQNGYPYSSDQCGIWIDWNNDFCFGAGEQIAVTGTPGGGPYTATINPPCDITPGEKRLRIRVMYTGTLSPCGNTSYGEVEDYTINVLPYPVVDPLAVVTPNPQFAYYAHALDPIINSFYVGNFAGFLPNQVNLATVQVNGETPTSVSVIPSYTGIYCGALKIQMPLADFIDNYGTLYDTTNTTFVVTGNFNDVGATPFAVTGDVTLIGHASSAPTMFILPPTGVVLPGDFDASGALDISDPVAMVAYIFAGGAAPSNLQVGDCDCSGTVDISDAVYMISYIFGGGAAPCR